MGNGNTKPPLGPTEFEPEAEELARGLNRQKSTSTPRVNSKRHAPFGDTNAATTIGSSTKTSSGSSPPTPVTSKDRLVAPSSNPLRPAAFSTSPLPTKKNSSTNPNVASPVRVVFSASLERSLGKRRPGGLRCSSSWTSGKLTRDTDDPNTTAAAAAAPIASSSSSSSQRRRWMPKTGDGVGKTIKATGRQASSTAPTPAPTPATTTTRQDKKKGRRRSVPRDSTEAPRQGEEDKAREATTRGGSKTHRWEDGFRRRNRLASPSRLETGGDGDSVTFVETIADLVDNDDGSPEDAEQQCQGDLVRPSRAGADSSLEPVGDEDQKTAGGAAARKEEQGSHSGTGGRGDQHPSRGVRRNGGGNRKGTLPMVKCWEGNAFVKEGGKGGGAEEERRPHGRPVRSRSHADKTFLQRTSSDARNPSSFVVAIDGKSIRNNNRMEAGSAGVAAATTESGGGAVFGRASSEGLGVRQPGGGRGGMRAVRGGGGGGGGGGGTLPSTASSTSPPPQLQLPVASAEDATCFDLSESRSVSSANSLGVVQEQLSVCSSLPPMGGAGNGTGAGGGGAAAADLIFEESSFEDSVASASQASSAERCGVDAFGSGSDANGEGGGGGGGGGGGRGGGGGIGRGGKRGRGGPAPRQRSRSSSDEFVRTRSVGRGLSNLMARIHEQDEFGGNTLESQWKPLPRDLDSRPGAGEVFRVQELSDCDEDGLESELATSSPPAVTAAAAAATVAAVNMGHQRASLELRNLALEREAKQLKTHLRSMGGDDVVNTDRHLHDLRPRPRPHQQRAGEQVLLRRSAAPPPVSDPAPSITHRSGGGGSSSGRNGGSNWRSSGGGDETARGKADVGRARRWSDSRRGGGAAPDPSVIVVHAGRRRSPRAAGEPDNSSSSATPAQDETTVVVHARQPAPSPPRKRGGGGHRVSVAAAATAEPPATSSPVRKLRSNRLRSPVCAAGGASVAQAPPQRGSRGIENVPLLEATGFSALDGLGGTSKSDHRDAEEKPVLADPRQTPRHDSSGEVGENRPLPRLRMEEAERRRGAPAKARPAKKSMNLGGMVSGMKHTLLSRRRSAGDKVTPLVVPAGTRASPAPTPTASGGGGSSSSSSKGKEVVPADAVDPDVHDSAAAAAAAAATAAAAAAAAADDTNAATNTEQAADKARQRGSHRPARGGERGSAVSSSSSVPPQTATTATGAITAMAARERQRGPGVSGGPTRGGRGGGAGEGIPVSGVYPKQALIEGISSATTATPPFEHLLTEDSGEQGAEAATEGVAATSAPAAATVVVAAEEAGAAAVDEVEDIAENSMPVYGRWPATLDARWAEVEFMLCHEVDCEESLQYTIEATEAGLVFMDKLEEKAQELGVLKGQLSRWLLPFNADTSVEEQQAATPRRFQESLLASSATSGAAGGVVGSGGDSGDNSGGGDGGGGGSGSVGLTEEEAEYLTDGARRVRQLVRLKIADDNDLNTAKEALITMSGFFVSISKEAAKRGGDATAFGVLQERRAMSPIMRPPPLPSIPRQAPATAATRATDRHHSATFVSASTKHPDPQKQSDCDGRGAPLTPASTATSASVGKAAGLTAARQGDRNNNVTIIGGGGRTPEANAPSSSDDKNRDDDNDEDKGGVPLPTARTPAAAGKAEAASVARVDEAVATAAAATGSGPLSSANSPLAMGGTKTSATTATPTELTRTPRDSSSSSRSQEKTAAEAAATRATLKTAAAAADTSERPGALRGVGGSRQQARVAGKATMGVSRSSRGRSSASRDSLSTTTASADIAGGERGLAAVSTAAAVPSGLVEHSPRYGAGGASGTALEVAPAGSLVRLKRRQQARTRSNSQR
ncbi:unnamed protein product [Ectocarpus fasciculatus]